MEPAAYRAATHVVAPSIGLARELIQEFPMLAGKVTVIGNPIDVEGLRPPAGIGGQVVFVGRQMQARRFLWVAGAFLFPSAYETFALSLCEAAAAGLPLIVTRLHGVEDFARNHENAFVIDRSVPAVRAALTELLELSFDRRQKMGLCAQDAVSRFTVAQFAAAWKRFYQDVMPIGTKTMTEVAAFL
jgi:hypothetical protein